MMNMSSDDGIVISQVTADQIAIIQALERNSSQHPWSDRQIADSLTHDHLTHSFSFSSNPQELIGYWILQQVLDELHLLNYTIAKPYQGKGIGSSVLQQLISCCRTDSSLQMFSITEPVRSILLEVRESNSAAQRVYLKCGFDVVGERKHYYRNGTQEREKAILMRCII